jgi:chromate transporter
LDGLAICSVIPSPLIVFGAFVGFAGGGLAGALAVTVAIFAPAFAFGLTAHELLERALQHATVRACLDGVSAGVVGLIVATAVGLAPVAVGSWGRALIAAGALLALMKLRGRWSVLWVVLGAAATGWLGGALLKSP